MLGFIVVLWSQATTSWYSYIVALLLGCMTLSSLPSDPIAYVFVKPLLHHSLSYSMLAWELEFPQIN